MKRILEERTRHFPQDEKARATLRRRKIQKRNDGYNREKLARKQKKLGIMRRRGRTQRKKNRIIFRMVLPYSVADLWRRASIQVVSFIIHLSRSANAGHAALSMQQQLEGMKMGSGSRNAAGTIATNKRDKLDIRPQQRASLDRDAKIINGLEGSASSKQKSKEDENAVKRTAHYVIPDDSNPAGESDTRASIVGQAEDGVAKSIGNHADEDGDQRAEAEEQQIGQAALIRMKGQLCRGKAQQGQSIADMEDRERRRIVTLHNNSGSKE
ncbi:hypothetical protein C8F01DRAFT_1083168 [Mycena amicta]|nr:hypothetical protein C8F01DRAFT_1083168 [Mycena amicta]